MRLPNFSFLRSLRSKPAADAKAPRARARAAQAAGTALAGDENAVAAARTAARRRLVGALVLLLIGIVGFPVLFETQPRPLPLDIPIAVPLRDGAATAAAEPRKPLPLPSLPDDAGSEVAVSPALAAEPAPTPVAPVPAPAPAPATPAPAPATAVAAPTPATPATLASTPGRFVVQIGAFTDPGTLREARAKVEKLGLKTYTQVIENDAGKRTRVRVGPFPTREEAEAAASRLKGNGLPANVLTL